MNYSIRMNFLNFIIEPQRPLRVTQVVSSPINDVLHMDNDDGKSLRSRKEHMHRLAIDASKAS